MKLKFWRPDWSETVDDAHLFEIRYVYNLPEELEGAAEEYAEYYHDNRDGWESSWPIIFNIADEDGKYLGSVEVDRETRPHFVGKQRQPEPAKETPE